MSKLQITQYFQTENPCYKAGRKITPSGIVVHSTGANNPYLKRYVGADDGIIGKNQYNNHWNKSNATKCVHAFIGKAADGSVKIYQTLPWNYRCWGVGSGKKGSYNNSHIQFEICEDGLTNEKYYKDAFGLAKQLCAFLCAEYGISTDNVVGHYEAASAGYGSNHADPRNWQRKFDDSMKQFRADVAALLGAVSVDTATEAKPAQPKAEAPAQTTAETTYTTYTVKRGDSLWAIAKKLLGSGSKYTKIQKANGMSSTAIRTGQKLKIPKG